MVGKNAGVWSRLTDFSAPEYPRVKRKRSETLPAPMNDYSDLSESFCSIFFRRFRS